MKTLKNFLFRCRLIVLLITLGVLLSSCVTKEVPIPSPINNTPSQEDPAQEDKNQNELEFISNQLSNAPKESIEDVNLNIPEALMYEVTEEEYTETFEQIEEYIANLNRVIARKNYTIWKQYLTPEFIEHYQSAETLSEYSQMPALERFGIVLRNLSDYFNYVVIPSRSNARLDDIEFIDDTHIKAIMVIEEQRVILYSLQNINGQWKIAYW